MNGPDFTLAQADNYELQPDEIEGVLQELWRESLGEGEEAAVVQVRTLNLLVFVPAALITPDVQRSIEAAAVRHPGRTITMIVSDGPQPVKAYAAIACRFDGSGKQLCGEQITITCGDGGAPLPSIAASLLGAGVPTFLWWLGDPPFASPLYDSLVEIVDHVVVDGRTWQQPLVILPELAATIRAQSPYIAYTDLQWTTLTAWRRFTAQCFDVPDALPHLNRLQRVTITHGEAEQDFVQALLFGGWLSSRAGWEFVQRDGATVTVRNGTETLAIVFVQRAATSGLHEIMLESSDATFQIVAVPEMNCVKTTINLPNHAPIERMARASAQSLEALLDAELDLLNRDLGFEGALMLAARVAAA